MGRILDNDWENFEKLVFETLLSIFHLPCDERNRLTKHRKDGGFDGIFYIPPDISRNEEEICAIMEAKLRGNVTRDLPLQDFSKAMIIAINRAAGLLVVASNLRLSSKTIQLLKEFSQNTGLKIKLLSVKTLYEHMNQMSDLKQNYPPSLLTLLEKSYAAFIEAYKSSSELQVMSIADSFQTERKAIELFSSKRERACAHIVKLFEQEGGFVTVEGSAGIGKSFFVAALQQKLEKPTYKLITIDLKNCNTSRILFVELVKGFWCLPEEQLQAIGKRDFAQAIAWIGNGTLDPNIKKAVIVAFQKGKQSYLEHADIFHYYLIEYLIQLYSQIQKRRNYVLCFANLNYAQADLIEFLLQFLKRFGKRIHAVLEVRTSIYIDDKMQSEQWDSYIAQIRQLPSLLYRYELTALSTQEYCDYINYLLDDLSVSIYETEQILKKSGKTLLLINAFLTFLKGNGFLDIPAHLRVDYITDMPVDHGQQIIPMLVDLLSSRGSFFSGLFFLTYLFQGSISLTLVDMILGEQRDELNYLLKNTDIFILANQKLHVSHALYLDYFATRQYISITYQQELANLLLSACKKTSFFSSPEEETICYIRLYEILNDTEQVAKLSLSFGISMHQYGQYTLSQKYIKIADEKLTALDGICPDEWPRQHIIAVLTLLENELYLQDLDRKELKGKLDLLEQLFHNFFTKIGNDAHKNDLRIQYYLIEMRVYHYWGEYKTSFEKIEQAICELTPATKSDLAGRVWLEYAIATKEMYSLKRCLQVFRLGRRNCPHDKALLFSNLTHLSEKYSTTNARIAMRFLQMVEPFKMKLPLSSILHHEINVATMWMYSGSYDEALEMGREIIHRANQAGLKNEEARCSNLLGCLFFIQNDFQGAERNLAHGVFLIPENKHVTVLWPILSNLLSVQLELESWDAAHRTAKRCMKIFRKSYKDRINHLKVAEGKYPKLFVGLLLLLRGLIVLNAHTEYSKAYAEWIKTLLEFFQLPELVLYYERITQGEALETILQKTPFYQAGKLVIKS